MKDLRDELAELRQAFSRRQGNVVRALAAVFLLLGIIGGGVWWIKSGQKITDTKIENLPGKLKVILVLEIEKQMAPIRAELAAPASDIARNKAEGEIKALESRLAHVDENAARYAKSAAQPDSIPATREVTRILAQNGVDAALTFAGQEKAGILASIRAGRHDTRAKLQPLLIAAYLQATKGQAATARASFRELLALDPDWPEAIGAYAEFLHDQSYQSELHENLSEAVADAEEALALATRLPAASPGALRLLAVTHQRMGGVLTARWQTGDADKAMEHLTRSLDFAERDSKAEPGSAMAALNLSTSLMSMGDFLTQRQQPGDLTKAKEYLTRFIAIWEPLQKANPRLLDAAWYLAISYGRMADLALQLGDPNESEKQQRLCYDLLKSCIGQGMAFDAVISTFYEQLRARFGGK